MIARIFPLVCILNAMRIDKGLILFLPLAEYGQTMAGVERGDKQPVAHWNATSMKLASLVKAEATIQNMHMHQNCKGKLLG